MTQFRAAAKDAGHTVPPELTGPRKACLLQAMRRCLSSLAFVFCATGAAAEPFDCAFTVLCTAGSGCETLSDGVRFEVIAADHEGQLFLRFPTGAAPAERISPPGERPAQYTAFMTLLTILEDGSAAYSKHIGVERLEALSYLGFCGEL